MVCVRHVGTCVRRIRGDAASARAEGGEKSPARRHAGESQRQFRNNLSYFHLIPANSTSRPRGGHAPNAIPLHLLRSLAFLYGHQKHPLRVETLPSFARFLSANSSAKARWRQRMSLCAANQLNSLSMNHLYAKPGRLQSRSIKVNQGVFLWPHANAKERGYREIREIRETRFLFVCFPYFAVMRVFLPAI